jgi:hypothetical protein
MWVADSSQRHAGGGGNQSGRHAVKLRFWSRARFVDAAAGALFISKGHPTENTAVLPRIEQVRHGW